MPRSRSTVPAPADMQPLDPERDILEGREPVVARHRVEVVDADPIHAEVYRRNHPEVRSARERLAIAFNEACAGLKAEDPQLHRKLAPLLNVVAGLVNAGNFS